MPTLYEYPPSGNCYKVRLLLHHLGVSFKRVTLDVKKGETRTPQFRARFPLGRVPVLELDGGEQLAESNAILSYFAEGTDYLSSNRLERAQTLQWMFWEQYSHEPYVAVARAWLGFFGVPSGKELELRERQGKGYAALDTMERQLGHQPWFSGERYGIADISLYAYTHVAPMGGFNLDRYNAINGWLARVRNQPRHVTMEDFR